MRPIYNFKQVNDRLACSGQPTEDQLKNLAADGYKVVINLALTGAKYSLPDEAKSVAELDLVYHHIPVQFDNPQLSELGEFLGLMQQHQNEKTLVHCAANYRASCFTGLYLLATRQLSHDDMTDFIVSTWQPDPIWLQFVEDGVDWLNKLD
ncbi:MAG: protein tyrosine phosphatase family protein [Bacteroidetes bacterium]|nr:protein tyrosine phosphatase family protein [Bacteroidota bacterium]